MLSSALQTVFSFLLFAILVLTPFRVHSDVGGESADLFQKGLAAYQAQKFNEARDDFQQLLDRGVVSAGVLHNLALANYHLDQKPIALALWRKALSVRPGYPPAIRGREFLETKMQMRPLERDSLNLWIHRQLEHTPLSLWLAANALLLTLGGWLWIRYVCARRLLLADEQPLPSFPFSALFVSGLFFLSAGGIALKAMDQAQARATIVARRAVVRSLPSDNSVNLFEINGGSEVLVRQGQVEWTQVQNGDGATGWVKNGELIVTTGR
jgi:hypothetical protein